MKHKLLFTLGLFVLGWAVFAAGPTEAVTAAGPYYAMPSWDQTLTASTRFIVLTNMGGAAVLDRETGLVWEQSPSTSTFSWEGAHNHCIHLTTGNRMGWHFPTLQELSSLVDPSVAAPALPSGHPFSNVQLFSPYWSATTTVFDTGNAWSVLFSFGFLNNFDKIVLNYVWCVRGGHGADLQ